MLPNDLPVNKRLLFWARDEQGLSLDDAALEAGIDKTLIKSWEDGATRPSLTQIERLSDAYRRPISVFFRKDPPPASLRKPNDRRLLAGRADRYHFKTNRAIRLANNLQDMAFDLFSEFQVQAKLKLAKYTLADDPEVAAETERKKLNVPWPIQKSWQPSKGFSWWRKTLEDTYRLLVFRLEFPLEDARGFSITGKYPFVIAINKKEQIYGRNFTLFHEFAHFLLREDGICLMDERKKGRGADFEIERWCNRFAAGFLLPEAGFLAEAKSFPDIADGNFESLRAFSDSVKVSGHAILIRMAEYGLLPADEVDELATDFNKYLKANKRPARGPKIYATNIVNQKGNLLPKYAVSGYEKGVVSHGQMKEVMGYDFKHYKALKKLVEGMP